ncbi:EamA-like transporter family protein [Anseongella ginsenosidimutans]|uniref:EamA-like transporter family protein n=1 Tax=Anseongella ginsenosidimutans TaxID=496056 RepID=A0A4R3KU60_9SPHI|nr:DMT family transporter [Anseongella ginsenosidimutans]TCS88185.1 EamA-like transporter family protein [Anseongella ginsenosidimutans]
MFIWGFTAILGALISLDALPLVWYRVLFAGISLAVFLRFRGKLALLPSRKLLRLLGIGLLVSGHWICFYHSIKVSAVAVTLVCLSAQTLFTGLLEPAFNKRRLSLLDVFTGIMIIAGIALIFHFETRYTEGIIVGLLAALLACLFTIFNSWEIKKHDPVTISFYEMTGGWLGMTGFIVLSGGFNSLERFAFSNADLFYLILLSTVCTAFAYVWGVAVMRELSAYTVILITNMEPVYGILLAVIFFGESERMTTGFYLGALIIIAAVFLHPVAKKHLLAIPAKRT